MKFIKHVYSAAAGQKVKHNFLCEIVIFIMSILNSLDCYEKEKGFISKIRTNCILINLINRKIGLS